MNFNQSGLSLYDLQRIRAMIARDTQSNIDVNALIESINQALEAIDQLNLEQLNNQVDELYAFLNNIKIEDEEGVSVLEILTMEIASELASYGIIKALKWAVSSTTALRNSPRPEVAQLMQGEQFAEQFVQNMDDIAQMRVNVGELSSQAQEAIENSGEALQQAQTAGQAASAAQAVTDDIVSSLLNTGITAGGMAATAAGLSSAMSATGATFGGIAAAGAALGALGAIGSLGGGATQGGEDYVGVEGLAQFVSNFIGALDAQGFTSVANFVGTVRQNQTRLQDIQDQIDTLNNNFNTFTLQTYATFKDEVQYKVLDSMAMLAYNYASENPGADQEIGQHFPDNAVDWYFQDFFNLQTLLQTPLDTRIFELENWKTAKQPAIDSAEELRTALEARTKTPTDMVAQVYDQISLSDTLAKQVKSLQTEVTTTVEERLAAVENEQTTQNNEISSLWSSQGAQDTIISEIQTTQLEHTNQISGLQTQTSDLQTNINSVGNSLSQLTTQLQNVEPAIQTAEQLRIELMVAGKTEYELVVAAFDNTGGGGGTGDVTQAEFDALSSRVTSIESFNNIAQVQLWDPSINSLETLYQRLRQSIPIPPENDHIGSHLISNDAGITNSTNFDFANTTGLQMDQLTFQVFVRFRDTMDSRVAVGSWASISAWGHSGGWDAGTSGSQGFYIIQHPTLANTFRLTTHLQFYHVFAGARFFWPVVDRIQIYIYHRNYSNRLTYWGGGQAGGGGGPSGEVTQAEFDALAVRVSSAEVEISQIKVVNNTQQNALDALASFTLPAITSKNTQQDNEISLLQNKVLMLENGGVDYESRISTLETESDYHFAAERAGIEIYQSSVDVSSRRMMIYTRDNAGVFRNTATTTAHVVLEWDYVDHIEIFVNYTRASQNLTGATSDGQVYSKEAWISFVSPNSAYSYTLPGPAGSLDIKDFTIDAYAVLKNQASGPTALFHNDGRKYRLDVKQ